MLGEVGRAEQDVGVGGEVAVVFAVDQQQIDAHVRRRLLEDVGEREEDRGAGRAIVEQATPDIATSARIPRCTLRTMREYWRRLRRRVPFIAHVLPARRA